MLRVSCVFLAVGAIALGAVTGGAGDILLADIVIANTITVGATMDIAGVGLGALSTGISCAQSQWISCGLGVASLGLGGTALWGDWGYADAPFGKYFNGVSTLSGGAGSIWSQNGVDNPPGHVGAKRGCGGH